MGDEVNMFGGSQNIGIVKGNASVNQAGGGAVEMAQGVRNLLAAVDGMRGHLSADDGESLDEALADLDLNAEPKALRRALSRIAGIAILVGKVGAPVIAAVEAVRVAMGN